MGVQIISAVDQHGYSLIEFNPLDWHHLPVEAIRY